MQAMLARKLRVLRAERGLTLREAEQLTGVDKDTLSKIERGLRHPYDVTLSKLAKGYDVPVEELLEEPVPLAKTPETGRSKMTAERALEIADSDSFRREAEDAPTEELNQTALELARFTEPQKREVLVRNKDPKEAHRRVIAQERIGIINVQLYSRGTLSPVELVARQFNDAMTPSEETPRLAREEQEGKEVG